MNWLISITSSSKEQRQEALPTQWRLKTLKTNVTDQHKMLCDKGMERLDLILLRLFWFDFAREGKGGGWRVEVGGEGRGQRGEVERGEGRGERGWVVELKASVMVAAAVIFCFMALSSWPFLAIHLSSVSFSTTLLRASEGQKRLNYVHCLLLLLWPHAVHMCLLTRCTHKDDNERVQLSMYQQQQEQQQKNKTTRTKITTTATDYGNANRATMAPLTVAIKDVTQMLTTTDITGSHQDRRAPSLGA